MKGWGGRWTRGYVNIYEITATYAQQLLPQQGNLCQLNIHVQSYNQLGAVHIIVNNYQQLHLVRNWHIMP